MSYDELNQCEKSALEKYVEIEQLELLNCADDSEKKLRLYIRSSIGPDKVKIQLPQNLMLAIQKKVLETCRHKKGKRNKA